VFILQQQRHLVVGSSDLYTLLLLLLAGVVGPARGGAVVSCNAGSKERSFVDVVSWKKQWRHAIQHSMCETCYSYLVL
jgi:hypothetical protein